MRKKKKVSDAVGLRGFFRVQLEESGEIVGDSGWKQNNITTSGLEFWAKAIAATAGSDQVTHVAVGTGGNPASNATALAGEILGSSNRVGVTVGFTDRAASNSASTLEFTATFASSDSYLTGTQSSNLSNIGLFGQSQTGTLHAGKTYASSSWASNQNVNCSYQIQLTGPTA